MIEIGPQEIDQYRSEGFLPLSTRRSDKELAILLPILPSPLPCKYPFFPLTGNSYMQSSMQDDYEEI